VSTKKRSGNQRKQPVNTKNRPTSLVLAAVAAVVLLLGGWYALGRAQEESTVPHEHGEAAEAIDHVHGQGEVEIPHMHGIGFSSDGRQLFVAAHDGFRVFADGEWLVPKLPAHDYMGYAATDNGFYSSGHPDPGSRLVNPLGLVKSTDGGNTLTTLAFEGESDFHLMGVGYKNHAIYVLNPAPNSRLSTGMHYSLDDGKTWQASAMQGVTGRPFNIAVHPTEANVVALATEDGLFLSSDHGETFERLGEAGPVTGAAFSPSGERLFFGYNTLYAYDLESEEIDQLQTPPVGAKDAIAYIAVNPSQSDEITFATFSANMYRSQDGGQSWEQIAENGKGT
jgi:DNA-binding beta-propeller fold protein YncE